MEAAGHGWLHFCTGVEISLTQTLVRCMPCRRGQNWVPAVVQDRASASVQPVEVSSLPAAMESSKPCRMGVCQPALLRGHRQQEVSWLAGWLTGCCPCCRSRRCPPSLSSTRCTASHGALPPAAASAGIAARSRLTLWQRLLPSKACLGQLKVRWDMALGARCSISLHCWCAVWCLAVSLLLQMSLNPGKMPCTLPMHRPPTSTGIAA